MTDDDLWALERGFWLGGPEAYGDALHPACLMAFPDPAGLMAGPAIVESLKHGPRWTDVAMDDRRLARPSADVAVLAYTATGRREGAEPYQAYCMSTYVAGRLVQHQHTPR